MTSDMLPAILGYIAVAALICGIVNHLLTSRSQRLDSRGQSPERFFRSRNSPPALQQRH